MITNAQRIERLANLRRVLNNHKRAIARNKATVIGDEKVGFDMSCWVDSADAEGFKCTTAACAFGSCGFDSYFTTRGLRTNKNRQEVRFGRYEGLDAAKKFFGISLAEAEWLFDPDTYRVFTFDFIEPSKVLVRVNSLIKFYRSGVIDDAMVLRLCEEVDPISVILRRRLR